MILIDFELCDVNANIYNIQNDIYKRQNAFFILFISSSDQKSSNGDVTSISTISWFLIKRKMLFLCVLAARTQSIECLQIRFYYYFQLIYCFWRIFDETQSEKYTLFLLCFILLWREHFYQRDIYIVCIHLQVLISIFWSWLNIFINISIKLIRPNSLFGLKICIKWLWTHRKSLFHVFFSSTWLSCWCFLQCEQISMAHSFQRNIELLSNAETIFFFEIKNIVDIT